MGEKIGGKLKVSSLIDKLLAQTTRVLEFAFDNYGHKLTGINQKEAQQLIRLVEDSLASEKNNFLQYIRVKNKMTAEVAENFKKACTEKMIDLINIVAGALQKINSIICNNPGSNHDKVICIHDMVPIQVIHNPAQGVLDMKKSITNQITTADSIVSKGIEGLSDYHKIGASMDCSRLRHLRQLYTKDLANFESLIKSAEFKEQQNIGSNLILYHAFYNFYKLCFGYDEEE